MTLDFEAFVRLPRAEKRRILFNGAKHHLYRCYDADGVLLYIGCSNDVEQRMKLHTSRSATANASRWLAVCMDRYEVEGPFPNRPAGRMAEREAIVTEQPLFNMQHRGKAGWLILHDVARYLISRGHGALAIETACTCWSDDGSVADYCAAHHPERVASAAHGGLRAGVSCGR